VQGGNKIEEVAVTLADREFANISFISQLSDSTLGISLAQRHVLPYRCMAMGTRELQPERVPMRTKKTLRCRLDVDSLKSSSILLLPKPIPLEGDSSQLANQGKWWMKDCSAVHEWPYVSVLKLPSMRDMRTTGVCYLHLMITNSKETNITVQLNPLENHRELFLLSSKRPPLSSDVSLKVLHAPPAPPIELKAYEDDLLRDDADDVASRPLYATSPDNEKWGVQLDHNAAKICIPLRLSEVGMMEEESFSGLVEMNFSVECKEVSMTEDNDIKKIALKLIFNIVP
jgi:hypothetical protein